MIITFSNMLQFHSMPSCAISRRCSLSFRNARRTPHCALQPEMGPPWASAEAQWVLEAQDLFVFPCFYKCSGLRPLYCFSCSEMRLLLFSSRGTEDFELLECLERRPKCPLETETAPSSRNRREAGGETAEDSSVKCEIMCEWRQTLWEFQFSGKKGKALWIFEFNSLWKPMTLRTIIEEFEKALN